jgi:hypothetical protein
MADLNYEALYKQTERQNEVLMDIIDRCKEVTCLEQCVQCEVMFWPRRSGAANDDAEFCSVDCEEENKRENA